MPTSTFYRLPQEKRQKLMDAIRQELLRVSYEEISINKIIQNAGISRGSFYQYFTDKNDMMQTILGDFKKRIQDISKESLRKHNGDPFALVQDIFDLFCRVSAHTNLCLLYQNLLAGLKIKDERISYPPFCLSKEKDEIITSYVDLSLLDIKQPEDLYDCIDILASQLKWAVVEFFSDPDRKEEIAASFQNKIAILRRGMAPKQEERKC